MNGHEREDESFLSYEDSSVCESSYASSWCSTVYSPILRPKPQRAASPTPEVAFACGKSPFVNKSDHSQFSASNIDASAFDLICSISNCVGKHTFEDPIYFQGSAEMGSVGKNKDAEIHRNIMSGNTETRPQKRVLDDNHLQIYKSALEDHHQNNFLNDAKQERRGDHESRIQSLRCLDALCTSDIPDSTPIVDRNNGQIQEDNNCREMTDLNPIITTKTQLVHKSAWWIRRERRKGYIRRKRRRSSPVMDNMPNIPESPSIPITVSPTSVSDHVPLSADFGEFGKNNGDQTTNENNRGITSPSASTLVIENLIKNEKKSFAAIVEDHNSSIGSSIQNPVGPPSILKTEPKCHKASRTEPIVPLFVTCGGFDDSCSVSTWMSHSRYKTDFSESSTMKFSNPSESKSLSTQSCSIPIIIGPAYKFAPIEREFSYGDSESYEVNSIEQVSQHNYGSSLGNVSVKQDDKDNLDLKQIDDIGTKGNYEEWCLFDIPLILTRTVCDWVQKG